MRYGLCCRVNKEQQLELTIILWVTPNGNICTLDITFDNEIIRIHGESNDFDDEITVSIRNPRERLIERFDLALNTVIRPMRDLHNLISL